MGIMARVFGYDLPFAFFIYTMATCYHMMLQVRVATDSVATKRLHINSGRLLNVICLASVFVLLTHAILSCWPRYIVDAYTATTIFVGIVLLLLGLVSLAYGLSFARTIEQFDPGDASRRELAVHLRWTSLVPAITGTIHAAGVIIVATVLPPQEEYWICLWLIMTARIVLAVNAMRLALRYYKKGVSSPIPLFRSRKPLISTSGGGLTSDIFHLGGMSTTHAPAPVPPPSAPPPPTPTALPLQIAPVTRTALQPQRWSHARHHSDPGLATIRDD